MAAFERALGDGAVAIELDLQLTSDDQVVVFHDPTLAKLGLPGRRIAEFDIREVASLDAGRWFSEEWTGAKIPLLDEVLERFGHRTCLILEIKARDADVRYGRHLRLADCASAIVQAHSLADRVAWISFSAQALWRVRELAPEAALILNTGEPPLSQPEFLAHCSRLAGVSTRVDELTASDVVAAHEAGCPVLTYPVESDADLALSTVLAVDALLTSHPAWIVGQRLGEGVS